MFKITNTPDTFARIADVFTTDNPRLQKYGRLSNVPRQLSLHVDPESLGEPSFLRAFALISDIDRLHEIDDPLSGDNVTAAIYIVHPYDTFEPELYYRNEMGLHKRHFEYAGAYEGLMWLLETFRNALWDYYGIR